MTSLRRLTNKRTNSFENDKKYNIDDVIVVASSKKTKNYSFFLKLKKIKNRQRHRRRVVATNKQTDLQNFKKL
jgi:hypothetical protein